MALDLNKPIGPSAAASTALPTKRTMNLLVRERKNLAIGKYVLVGLGILALLAVFAKFAVFDVFNQVGLKQLELDAAQQEFSAIQRQLDNYDAVLTEYHSYTGIAAEGSTDALEVMEMIARVVQPHATVTAASASNGMVLVNVKDVTLDGLGKLTDLLRAEPLVENVTVSSATDTNAQSVSASLTITLAQAASEGGK